MGDLPAAYQSVHLFDESGFMAEPVGHWYVCAKSGKFERGPLTLT